MRSLTTTITAFVLSLGVNGSPAAPPSVVERRGINPTIPGYAYDGCVGVTSHEVYGKPLQAGASGGDDNMTVEKCAAICWGYNYFGVEYGRECYCGWELHWQHFKEGSDANCNIACVGDWSQNCGGNNRASVYKRTHASPEYLPAVPVPSFVDEGCHTEATSGRALTSGVFYSNEMNVQTCAIACEGYDYFGLEWYRECYCGNVLNTGSVPTLSTECNLPCSGQGGDTCGGNGRLNVYSYSTLPPPSSTASPVPTPTPTDLVVDGSFEGPPATPGSPTAWTIVNPPTISNYTYDFADTSLAFSGINSVSFHYSSESRMDYATLPTDMVFSIRQDGLTLIPDRRYKLSFWYRGSLPGPITGVESFGCEASLALLPSAGAIRYLAGQEQLESPAWQKYVYYYTNTVDPITTTSLRIIVRCVSADPLGISGRAPAPDGIKFHIDVVKLELVPEGQNFIA